MVHLVSMKLDGLALFVAHTLATNSPRDQIHPYSIHHITQTLAQPIFLFKSFAQTKWAKTQQKKWKITQNR